MQAPRSERKFKLIKFFRVQSDRLEEKLKEIKGRVRKMTDWSRIEENKQTEDRLMLFPNESIYNEGIKISTDSRGHTFELLKGHRPTETEGSIMYEYQNTFFYNDPTKIFQSIGYHQNMKRHKNVSIFTCHKYGLQIVIYENQNANVNDLLSNEKQKFISTHIEIRESSSLEPINEEVCFWRIFQNQFGDSLKPITAKEINHELMTIRKPLTLESMIDTK